MRDKTTYNFSSSDMGFTTTILVADGCMTKGVDVTVTVAVGCGNGVTSMVVFSVTVWCAVVVDGGSGVTSIVVRSVVVSVLIEGGMMMMDEPGFVVVKVTTEEGTMIVEGVPDRVMEELAEALVAATELLTTTVEDIV